MKKAEGDRDVWVGRTLTEDQTGEVQRDERAACRFEHDSSSAGVRLAGGKSPVSAPVPTTSGRDGTQFIRTTCLATPAQKLKTQAASLSRPARRVARLPGGATDRNKKRCCRGGLGRKAMGKQSLKKGYP